MAEIPSTEGRMSRRPPSTDPSTPSTDPSTPSTEALIAELEATKLEIARLVKANAALRAKIEIGETRYVNFDPRNDAYDDDPYD